MRGVVTSLMPCCTIRLLYIYLRELLELTANISMSLKRSRHKPDLFSVLLVALALGMSVTLAYQVSVYYGASAVPIATSSPAGSRPGG